MSTHAARAALGRSWLGRARTAIAGAAATIERLPVPAVLAGLVVVEWAAVLALARTVRHNGWIYYQGGDQLWYYTLGWLLGHGQLGQTSVGYGWPALLAPISRVAGANLVSALPAVVLLNVLVLLPVAMLALYGIAARIGGRLFGYWTLVLWIAVPFIGILYTNVGYHQKYTELLLPQTFGLTALADFPATVATVVSAYFCTRILFDATPRRLDAVAAGVAAGAAVAIKPSAAIFLVGPALAFAHRRCFGGAALFVTGIAPAALALAAWKERGLGYLPVLGSASAPRTLASGGSIAGPMAATHIPYVSHLDWAHFQNNLDLIREHFWSARVVEWLVIAGLIGLGRRSRPALLLVGGWFAAFVVVKGSYQNAGVEDGSVFRVLMPAFPAFVVLLASLPLLLPHAPRRLSPWRPAYVTPLRVPRRALLSAAVLVTALAPLASIALASVKTGPANAAELVARTTMPIPANIDIGLRATTAGGRVTLRWDARQPSGGPVFYRVWRGRASEGDGFRCDASGPGAPLCTVLLPEIGVTHGGAYLDRPGPGRWVYRIAVAANWLNDPQYGDVYLVGKPVSIAVP